MFGWPFRRGSSINTGEGPDGVDNKRIVNIAEGCTIETVLGDVHHHHTHHHTAITHEIPRIEDAEPMGAPDAGDEAGQ